MRRDLIIGIIVSLLMHGSIGLIGKPVPKPKPKEEAAPTVQLMEMPKIEPDEPEIKDPDEQAPTPQDFAPPMQTDVPQIVTDTSFVQQLQPPPPEGLRPNTG